MKEVKVKLYTFDELSEDAKHNVCEKERSRQYNFGFDCQEYDAGERVSTLDSFCKVFGIEYQIDYDHSTRFISWSFKDEDIDDRADDICGKYLLRFLNNYYYDIRSRKYYATRGYYDENRKYHYKFRHSRIIWIEQNCPFTGMIYDCDILDLIFDWYKRPDWKLSLRDLFENCFGYYLQCWDKEDEYRMSDENIGDMISANRPDDLYYEDGTKFSGIYEEDAA